VDILCSRRRSSQTQLQIAAPQADKAPDDGLKKVKQSDTYLCIRCCTMHTSTIHVRSVTLRFTGQCMCTTCSFSATPSVFQHEKCMINPPPLRAEQPAMRIAQDQHSSPPLRMPLAQRCRTGFGKMLSRLQLWQLLQSILSETKQAPK
jgi:hypothetical protein